MLLMSSEKLADVVRARRSFEEFATNDKFIDQDYYPGEEGVTIKDYHEEWVDALEEQDRIALTAFTGSGKTTIPGVLYPLWKIFTEPGYDILVVSATMQQSTKILSEIKHHIENSEYLSDLKPDKRSANWSKTEIETTSGSRIYCKPFSEGVKGVHVDLVICDEAAEFKDHELFSRYVQTRAEAKDGTICLISTPVHENDLMAKMSDGSRTPRCPECADKLDKDDDDNYFCEEHGIYTLDEADYNPMVSSKGYWSKTYPVYRELDEETELSFEVNDKMVEPLFPETFDERRIRELREEDMTMFQKEYLCLGEGTKIQLEEGMKNIEDVEVGDKVLTHKGNFKKVTKTMERVAGEKVKVKTKGWSEKIEMTPEHPVLTEEGWKEAKDLKPMDYLVTPRVTGDKSISDSLGKIYGFYLAEGSIGASGRQVTFNFGAHETELIEECKDSLRSEGYTPKLYGYGGDSVCRVTVNSVKLVEELTDKFGRAKEKKVPSEVFELDKSSIRTIFESYVDGDGYRANDGRGKISSVSLEVAEGAARMATSLGYTVSRDYFKEQSGGGVINGRKIEGNGEYHRVRYYKETQYNKIEDDYVAYRVKSVEFEKNDSKVYNIEVEDDHTYHTAQFAVHNCEPLAVEGDLFDPNDILDLYDKEKDFHQNPNPDNDYYMGCMPPGEKVKTEKGLKKIEDVEDEKLLTHTGDYERPVKKSVRQYMGDIYEVQPSYMVEPVRTTDEHPFYVYRDNEFTWVDAENLNSSDRLAIPLKNIEEDKKISEDTAYLAGRWLADGWTTQGSISICFGEKSESEKVKKLLDERGTNYYERSRETAIELNFVDDELKEVLSGFEKLAHNKNIPEEVWHWGEDKVYRFVKGYVDGDGCIHFNESKNELVVNAVSVSHTLLLDLQRLLGSLGIVSRISKLRGSGKMSIEGREVDTKDTFQLHVATKYAIRLLDKWGVNHSFEPGKRGRYSGEIIGDYLVVDIRTIDSYDYSGPVYNFEVENAHSYCNQNIATHNCDFAVSKQGDYSVYSVLEVPADGSEPVLCYMERIRGRGLPWQENRIKELNDIFDFRKVIVDETNFGRSIFENLKLNSSVPVEGQSFEMKARNNLIVGLKNRLESGNLVIPRGSQRAKKLTDKLYDELLGFGTSETQSGSISYQSTAKHDDTVMSLAMVSSMVKRKKPVMSAIAHG